MDHAGALRILARGHELWRIERDGDIVRTAHGRPGRPARTTVRVCETLEAAERWYARAIETRQGRGWAQTTAMGDWPAKCHPPEAVHVALEQQVRQEPWNAGLADEYAAWLAAQHDPRGTLAALQHRSTPLTIAGARASRRFAWLLEHDGSGAPDSSLPPSWWWCRARPLASASLDAREAEAEAEQELLTEYPRHFFGGLRDLEDRLVCTWHRGFLDTATLNTDEAVHDDEGQDDAELLRRLLRLRSARLLRGLCVQLSENFDGDAHDDLPALLGALQEGPPADALLSFSLGQEPVYDEPDPDYFDIETARDEAPILDSLARLGVKFPRLEHLALAGRGLDPGVWALPHLRHAELHFARPEEPALAAFGRAAWPHLRSLRLGLGDFLDLAAEAGALAVLGPVLTLERMPQLRHLALVHPPDADTVGAVLARVPTVSRLETLEISSSGLTGVGARELAAARRHFTNLRRLNLTDNYLTAGDERRLRRAFAGVQVYTGTQRTPEASDLDDDVWEAMQHAALGGAPAVPSGLLRSDDDLPDHLDDRFELLLDRVVVDPPTNEDGPRLPRPDAGDEQEPALPVEDVEDVEDGEDDEGDPCDDGPDLDDDPDESESSGSPA